MQNGDKELLVEVLHVHTVAAAVVQRMWGVSTVSQRERELLVDIGVCVGGGGGGWVGGSRWMGQFYKKMLILISTKCF